MTLWQREQLRHARQVRKLNLQRNRSHIRAANTSKYAFIRAMAGTGGIKAQIASNLGVRPHTVAALLDRHDWDDVRALWKAELDTAVDEAEGTILTAIRDHTDMPTATLNARWLLSRRRPKEYGDKSTTIVEGGENPLRVNAANINIDALNLPIETKRKLLEAIDAHERQMQEQQLQREGQQQLIEHG